MFRTSQPRRGCSQGCPWVPTSTEGRDFPPSLRALFGGENARARGFGFSARRIAGARCRHPWHRACEHRKLVVSNRLQVDRPLPAAPLRKGNGSSCCGAGVVSVSAERELRYGAFYWVLPVFDPDGDDEWGNKEQPARYGGTNDAGQQLWNYIGVDGYSDWPVRWIGEEIRR